ncbi:NUDIX hydrolase [Dinoroseobacter shibae DFL 12 = DSM 16493]|jgi:8-oxo-dGTP diphosphatase|uniref:NUDIX hydrolase n=1 Tax=Dinoroseobacter shibae (strain DSM 16493 / NCIMB 14021 / DFL 12) TaxID=398580 RepID=A8LPF4_DINSH|nr:MULTISPECIES: NUDIX hydrolase [Dinoroseobacter]ABV95219.1 NUDIX hydrolase [Dinoroseobacter shibae DFL 12 = DSM 16493]MDD9718062.1 NUDIX hydrolase [Dinoroseobacter sp. PD6]URF46632.1 NUDIX hydrolase [Dinoroseobacter shibae]URF50938.1 NUDIX hydrolase [Dinoroseobacter shibae]
MIRRYGEAVRAGQAYRRRPGAYALLVRGDQVLTTVQFGQETEIQLPGGGIDPGEAPLPALHREVLEETGWTMRLERKLGVFRRFTFMPEYRIWAEKLCHIYLGRPGLRVGPPLEENHLPLWLPISEAAQELASAGDRATVAAYGRSVGRI